jgi:chaperonin GroES
MTDLAEKVDLEAAAEGVKSLYKAPQPKVLDPDAMETSLLERMPQPTGWRMLILPYRGKETTEGGIYIPNKVLDDTQIQTVVGYVVKQGSLCYKEKDWVVFARYAGSRFRIEGGECRILNDDEILATIDDPEDILSL